MNIVVCDEDINELYNIKSIIEKYNSEKKYESQYSVSLFENTHDLLNFFERNQIDLLFLNTVFLETNGIDIARQIRTFNNYTKIVFISASADYAVDSYEVDASYYLLKPFTDTEIITLLDKFINIYITDINDSFFIKKYNNLTRIFYSSTVYVESILHKMYYHVFNQEPLNCYGKIKDCNNFLSKKHFIKCHKSYIVNLNYVSEITNKDFLLFNKTLIPISKKLYKKTYKSYMEYIISKGSLNHTSSFLYK